MMRIFLVSPLRPNADHSLVQHIEYAKECALDSFNRGEAPFVPHLLYTEILDDSIMEERRLGMAAGATWLQQAQRVAVYTDLGISSGMKQEIAQATSAFIPVEYRTLQSL